MNIGGYDFSFDVKCDHILFNKIRNLVLKEWQGCVEGSKYICSYVPSTHYFYKNEDARSSWNTYGLTDYNADDMISLHISDLGMSFIVGNKWNEAHIFILKIMNELGFSENKEDEKTVIKPGDKLYLITRRDMSPGYQAVQSCHAMRQFTADHPNADLEWFTNSNTLALLAVDDEVELMRLVVKAKDLNLHYSVFREPDMGGAITSIAIEPSQQTVELCKDLSLALVEIKDYRKFS